MSTTRAQARIETRSAVINAAGELFQERGFAATTVREIAQRAGVSVGTVMAAGDKEALLIALFDGLIEERQTHVDAMHPRGHVRCSAAAVELLEPFVRLFDERRELAQTYASILVSGRHSSVVFTELAERLISVFAELIEACGCASGDLAKSRAEALHAAYIGDLFMWSASPDASAAEFITRLDGVFATICAHEGGRS